MTSHINTNDVINTKIKFMVRQSQLFSDDSTSEKKICTNTAGSHLRYINMTSGL